MTRKVAVPLVTCHLSLTAAFSRVLLGGRLSNDLDFALRDLKMILRALPAPDNQTVGRFMEEIEIPHFEGVKSLAR